MEIAKCFILTLSTFLLIYLIFSGLIFSFVNLICINICIDKITFQQSLGITFCILLILRIILNEKQKKK
jgi:hypothetical protein